MPSKRQNKTKVITSLSEVPDGFVQVSALIGRDHPRRKALRRLLSDAHAEGHIRAYKLFRTIDDAKTGPVFVEPGEAMQFIADYDARMAAMRSEPDRLERIDIQETLDRTEAASELRVLLRAATELRKSIVDLTAAIELQIGSRAAGEVGG